MDIIKENMFFVVMGAVVLVALALFLVVVQGQEAENKRIESDVQGLKSSMERLLRLGEKLPTKVAIPAAEKYRGKHVEQVEVLKTQLSKMQLSTELPGLGTDEGPGAFKTVYEKKVDELKRQLQEKGIASGPETWHTWDWGEDVPSQEVQRVLATKEYSLIRELLEIIISPELHVMQLDRIEVNPGETRTGEYSAKDAANRPRRDPYFDVYPFVLELRMPFQRHELLVRELLRSKEEIPIYIRKVSMMRLEDDPRVQKHLPTTLYIGVRVEGWVLDYKLQEQKPATTQPGGFAAGGFRRGGRP